MKVLPRLLLLSLWSAKASPRSKARFDPPECLANKRPSSVNPKKKRISSPDKDVFLLSVRGGDSDGGYFAGDDRERYNEEYYGRVEEGGYGDGYDWSEYRSRRGRRYPEDEYYRGEEPPSLRRPSMMNSFPSNRKLGTLCLFGGCALTLLGVSLFFNKALLRLGNLLLVLGVPLFLGPAKTTKYFLQTSKMRATSCLFIGILLVVVFGRPILGMGMEVFGLLNLFGNMFPMVRILLSQLPVVGEVFANSHSGKRRSNRRYDRGYDDYSRDGRDDTKYY